MTSAIATTTAAQTRMISDRHFLWPHLLPPVIFPFPQNNSLELQINLTQKLAGQTLGLTIVMTDKTGTREGQATLVSSNNAETVFQFPLVFSDPSSKIPVTFKLSEQNPDFIEICIDQKIYYTNFARSMMTHGKRYFCLSHYPPSSLTKKQINFIAQQTLDGFGQSVFFYQKETGVVVRLDLSQRKAHRVLLPGIPEPKNPHFLFETSYTPKFTQDAWFVAETNPKFLIIANPGSFHLMLKKTENVCEAFINGYSAQWMSFTKAVLQNGILEMMPNVLLDLIGEYGGYSSSLKGIFQSASGPDSAAQKPKTNSKKREREMSVESLQKKARLDKHLPTLQLVE